MRLLSGLIFLLICGTSHAQKSIEDCEKYRNSFSATALPEMQACVTKFLEPLDPSRREQFGEKYDPRKYAECRKTAAPAQTDCEVYRLRRRPQPEYWPYEGKVPAFKWPDPPKQSIYRSGMSSREYFEALCKAEAGEWIYRTVDNVEGIYQIRPRNPTKVFEMDDRYVMEDPYGHTRWEADDAPSAFVGPPWRLYKYFERTKIIGKKVVGFERHSGFREWRDSSEQLRRTPMRVEVNLVLSSRYAFTWRGIDRENDRENGIAGGELAVVDLQNNELLALRRGFLYAKTVRSPGAVNFESRTTCVTTSTGAVPYKDINFTYRFVSRVLRPMPDVRP